jgi:hypothetical protein
MSLHFRTVACRPRSHMLRRAFAAGHGAHAAWATPWPRFVSGRARLLPRVIPVVSVINLVARGPVPPLRRASGSRPWRTAAPDTVPATSCLSSPISVPLPSNPGRPSRDQRPRIAHTPWRVILLKSPSVFAIYNPQSSAIWKFPKF